MATLQDQSQELWNFVKDQVYRRNGLNPDPSVYATYSPNVMDPLGMSGSPGLKQYIKNNGGSSYAWGTAPPDSEIAKIVNQQIAAQRINQAAQRNTPWMNVSQQPTGQQQQASPFGLPGGIGTLLTLLGAQEQKNNNERARNETLKRYDEAHQGYTDLGQRVQENIRNWGHVQQQVNAENAAKQSGDIAASLASRGLSNSTIGDAFNARIKRNQAMLDQDISERRDARAIEADMANTDRLLGVVERRNDTAPDTSGVLFQLAQQLGQSGGFGQPSPQYVPPENPGPNYSNGFNGPLFGGPATGMRAPIMWNLFGGVGDYLAQFNPTPVVPNRYPYNRYAVDPMESLPNPNATPPLVRDPAPPSIQSPVQFNESAQKSGPMNDEYWNRRLYLKPYTYEYDRNSRNENNKRQRPNGK